MSLQKLISMAVALSGWGLVGYCGGAAERQRLGELERQLAQYDAVYYGEGRSLVSDAVYDGLVQERERLRAMLASREAGSGEGGNDGEARRLREGASQGKHYHEMGGLEKVEGEAGLVEWASRRDEEAGSPLRWEVSPKLDGLAVNVIFRDGELESVLTRGDGRSGQVVTENFLELVPFPRSLINPLFKCAITGIPNRYRNRVSNSLEPDPDIDSDPDFDSDIEKYLLFGRRSNSEGGDSSPGIAVPRLLELRGEVYCPLDTFGEINEEAAAAGQPGYATARNLAAGALLSQEVGDEMRGRLRCILFDWGSVRPGGISFTGQADLRDHLRGWGLPVFGEGEVERAEAVADLGAVWGRMAERREDWNWPTDGVVVKVESVAERARLGRRAGNAAWALAVKWPAPGAWTRLREIELSVGRSGRVTPVGLVEPVMVAGRRVSRVSLYHPGHVMAMDMRLGDRVRLELAGDVIPELVEVDRSVRPESSEIWEMPENCTSCGERWEAVGASGRWECGNEDCPERRIGRLLDFVESGEVSGLGEGRLRVLWAAGLVAEPEDLFGLTRGQLEELPGFGPVLAKKILASIEAVRGTLKPAQSP